MQIPNWRISTKASASFALILVVLIFNGIIVFQNVTALHSTQERVIHTQEVLVQVESLFSSVKDAESSARAFVISGNSAFRTSYRIAVDSIALQLLKLTNLVTDNPSQQLRIRALSDSVTAELGQLDALVDAAAISPSGAERDNRGFSAGTPETARVREAIDEFRDEEHRLLTARSRNADGQRRMVLLAAVTGVLMGGVITGVAWYLIHQELEKRRQAEASARAERQNLLAALTSIGDAVIVTDASGRVKLVNAVARQLMGEESSLVDRPLAEIFSIVSASTRARAENPVEVVLTTGKVVGSVKNSILLRQNGTEIPIESSAAPVRDDSGYLTGVILIFRDCSERKKLEVASKEREHRFRRMFETPLIGIAVGNSAGYLEEANDAYLDLIGYRRGELDEASLSWGGVPVGQSPLSEIAQLELSEKGVCRPFERTYQSADGQQIPVLVSAARLHDHQDRIVVYVTDLTQSKRAEAAFRESESRFRVLSECMPQKVWTASPDGQLDYLNQMLIEYAGLPREQLSGWGWLDLIHPDDKQAHIEDWKSSLSTGDMFEFEHRLRKHTGEYRWHLARALPIYGPNKQVAMWLGTNTDIDDQKMAVESLREEHRRKDQFLAVLAHELRNPLAPLSNAVQVFSSVRNDPARSSELLAIMQRQLRQMTRLIDDLLDLARITQGRILLRRDRTTLRSVVDVAVEAVQPMISDRRHHLTVELPRHELWLNIDAARVSQILTNLLHNAAKYTSPHGQIALIVERTPSDVLFRVRDNGPGISPEMLSKVFDLFTQAEQTLDRSHGGLGIGLTLVRTLVELHGGKVGATSDGPGKGSEFTVRLPLRNEIPAAPKKSSPASLALRTLPTLRVLVVDDVQASAKTLAMMLRALGQDAEAVFDGKSAIDRLTNEHFDMAFLDIAMPGMDGLETARQLRTHAELATLTLVALTGFGQDEDRQRSLDAGFNEHLVKPTSLELLQEIIQRAAASSAESEVASPAS